MSQFIEGRDYDKRIRDLPDNTEATKIEQNARDDYAKANRRRQMAKKKDDRPIDAGLAALLGKSEQDAIEFWKRRLQMIAAIPSDVARVGAMTPQLRELVRIDNAEERKRLTAARLRAFVQLPPDVRDRLLKSRHAAFDVDRGVLEEDQRLVDEILPSIPEAQPYFRAPTAAR